MKKVICLLLIVLPIYSFGQADFIAKFKTDNSGNSSNTSVTFPISSATGYQVDFNNDADLLDAGESTVHTVAFTHDFGSTGTYTIRIVGNLDQITYDNSSANDPEKILSVDQWGTASVWSSMEDAFYGCSNLSVPATDTPDLSACNSMTNMFYGATNFNSPVDHWDVSKIRFMTSLFRNCPQFNQPLNSWDVSTVQWADFMFMNDTSFNQPLNAWTVTSMDYMSNMFRGASNFNQPLRAWDVSATRRMGAMFRDATSFNKPLNGWDISSVTHMSNMFRGATSFNQPLDSLNITGVSSLNSVFFNASSFNQSLAAWDVSGVTNTSTMFSNSGIDCGNYDSTLIGWEAQGITGISLDATALIYDQSLAARTSLTTTYSWTITGDSYMSGCHLSLPIELLSFNANLLDNIVYLDWQTVTEISNDYFIVQRSTDGINWTELLEVEGAGNSIKVLSYSAVDFQPIIGMSYYRLKQYDYDGTQTVSDVLSVNAPLSDGLSFNVYPNPTNGIVTTAYAGSQEEFSFEVMNSNGKVISATTAAINGSESAIAHLENYQSGVYLVRVFNKTTEKTFRVIKL